MSWAKLQGRSVTAEATRSEGYRTRSVGGHDNTFLALVEADPAFIPLSAYFDGCRMKRNECEYAFAGGVSDTDADSLLKAVQKFKVDAEAWMTARHPNLT